MQITSTTDLAERLRLAVVRTARRLRQQGEHGMTPTLASALASIIRHGPLTPSELAAREQVQRPTITRIVATLETAGLVERTTDPGDRRSSLLRATPDGTRRMKAAQRRKHEYLRRRLDDLDPEEREVLARAAEILERMLEGEAR